MRTNNRPVPTPERPARYVDTHGRHGWVYQAEGGQMVIEHCVNGRWEACPLLVQGMGQRAEHMAAYRHLRRRPHAGTLPLRLLGTHHAGGGIRHLGRWVHGPREEAA